MPKKALTEYDKFLEYLRKQNKAMTSSQECIARTILSIPGRGGKSWLIEELYNFDHRKIPKRFL